MNRYEIEGVLADVEAGRRVLFVGTAVEVAEAFAELGRFEAWAHRVYVNGLQGLTHEGGGRVLFRSYGQGLRGLVVDVVAVGPVLARSLNPDQLETLRAHVVPTAGEVIRL